MAWQPFGTSSATFSPFGQRVDSQQTTKLDDFDLTTVEGLRSLAVAQGIDPDEVVEPKKLSFLQRLSRGLNAFETGNAIYEAKYEGKNFVTEYLKDVGLELGSAISGKELRKDPESKFTFKDILVREGMKDREGKLDAVDVAGFFGDVLTDPTTFFGGAMVKGAGRGAKTVGQVAETVGAKIAPRQTAALLTAGQGVKDAAGKLFVHGYGTTEGLADEAMDMVNKMNAARTRVGKKYGEVFKELPREVHNDFAEGMIKIRREMGQKRNQLIEAGKSIEDATKIIKRDYAETMPSFKDIRSTKFYNETFRKFLGEEQKTFSNLTDMSEDALLQHYFPFIKKRTLRDATNHIRKSNEGWKKAFKGLLKEDEMLLDAPEAYATRAFQVEKDYIVGKELQQLIKTYGKPLDAFKTNDEALEAGYRVIKDKGIFGKELGYLPETDARFINEIFDPSYKAIERLAKATGFDAFTSLFKRGVTGIFPAFHSRNYVSGMIQNYEVLGPKVFSPANIADGKKLTYKLLREQTDGSIKIGKETKTVKELLEPFRTRFGYSSQYISDYGWEKLKLLTKNRSAFNPVTWPRALGNSIETQQKMIAYVTALRKGYDTNAALKLAEQAGFDYSKLTGFEKNVMRRLIPFYTFTRKNAELQLRTLANNPERLATLMKVGRAAGTPQTIVGEEEFALPDWMRNRFTANFGQSAYGLPQVLSGFGTPIEEQAELLDKGIMGILSRMNPLLRVPLERATGKDFFREQDLQDVYSASEYGQAPQVIKDFLQIREVEKPVYKGGAPTGEMRTVYVANPKRLQIARSMFTSRGVSFLHELFGDSELSAQGRVMKSLTGFKPYEVDETANKFFEDRDNLRDFTDFLQRLGIVKSFERAYIPKK